MFRLLLVSALVALACGVPSGRKAPRLDGRIVGGETVEIENYPYQLSLLSYGSHICGASIIGKRHAITAAHCTDGADAEELSVRAASSIRNQGGRVYKVEQIIQNPDYDAYSIDYDITILVLAEDIEFSAGAQPIGLPEQDQAIQVGSEAVCTGWGTLTEGGYLPNDLQKVSIAISDRSKCEKAYARIGYQVTARMICASVPNGGKDACQGDSGGPLVVDGNLVGVVSWGMGCGRKGYPGVFSSVSNLRSFITDNASI